PMKREFDVGSTSKSVTVLIQNSASATGAGLTGLAYNTASLTASYTFSGTNAGGHDITLASLATPGSASTSGGFVEIDATRLPGAYRLDLPDALLASGNGDSVYVELKGANNMVACPFEIILKTPQTYPANFSSLSIDGSGKVLLQPTQTGVTIP